MNKSMVDMTCYRENIGFEILSSDEALLRAAAQTCKNGFIYNNDMTPEARLVQDKTYIRDFLRNRKKTIYHDGEKLKGPLGQKAR